MTTICSCRTNLFPKMLLSRLGIFPRKLYSYLYFQSWNLGLWTPPDRKFLRREILPAFGREKEIRNVLFVGVRRYTESYAANFSRQSFVTLDIDPAMERFGGKNHITADVRALPRERFAEPFDLAVLNGVIGFGLNDQSSVAGALKSLAGSMRSGAWLVLGAQPQHLALVNLERIEEMRDNFAEVEFEGHHSYTFAFPFLGSVFHQYRFFIRR